MLKHLIETYNLIKKGDKYSGAIFDKNEEYRYLLWRYDENAFRERRPTTLCVVGLNPSTADELVLDPTCRKCEYFSKEWGYDGYIMLNIFGYRSTDPEKLKTVQQATSAEQDHNKVYQELPGYEVNDIVIREVCRYIRGMVLAAWGNHGQYLNRGAYVQQMLRPLCDLHAIRINSTGEPFHPLYAPNNSKPIIFQRKFPSE